jgi:serine/threonine-protein kinase
MSAEPRSVTNPEVWTLWANQVVNGAFALRCYLGGSDHSAVYLTEYPARNLPDAAIKFVRADALHAQAQLAQWEAAAALSHPHLVRLFEVGRCQIGGQDFLFVVMEYAEQALAQIVRQRALTPEEVRELLVPTLDALAFLHRNQLVHGQLRPSNILAVNDQLKLTSDTVRSAAHASTSAAGGVVRIPSPYDPPELKDGALSSAGDIWGLGMTLVEALTQRTTTWPDQQSATAALPANFPTPFAGMVRRCLSLAPASRPTVMELGAPFRPAPPARPVVDPQPAASPPAAPPPAASTSPTVAVTPPTVASAPPIAAVTPPTVASTTTSAPASAPTSIPEVPRATTPPKGHTKRHAVLAAIAAVTLISLASWVGSRDSETAQAQMQPPLVAPPTPVAAPVITKSAESTSGSISRPPPAPPLSVLHEVKPDVPQAVLGKIQGRIYVTVRVLVDPAGNVTGALLDNPGSSKYFARLADNAAREWQFAEADNQSPRVWLLRFEFSRDGVATRATEQ